MGRRGSPPSDVGNYALQANKMLVDISTNTLLQYNTLRNGPQGSPPSDVGNIHYKQIKSDAVIYSISVQHWGHLQTQIHASVWCPRWSCSLSAAHQPLLLSVLRSVSRSSLSEVTIDKMCLSWVKDNLSDSSSWLFHPDASIPILCFQLFDMEHVATAGATQWQPHAGSVPMYVSVSHRTSPV
jgi:hypothetical protein